ncbi:MAG: GNAT family N-acetyltransferase [Oscillospiraceae bacterium]|nr:GNAT family N-acetyltransferase [Oscillospiraceae bacterium]
MTLTTPRLTLVPHGMKYFESTQKYSSDVENCRYMFWLPRDTEEETRAFLRDCENEWKKLQPSFYEFAVLLDGIHIGAVSAYLEDDGSAELGWIVDKHHWGQGYAFEAASALLDFCRTLGIRHFVAHCDDRNIASKRIMEKLGMELTLCCGGRKNRASDELGTECLYELHLN